MIWFILVVEAILFSFYIWITYSPLKDQPSYPFIMAFFGITSQFLWAFAAQRIQDKTQMYVYGNIWDLMVSGMWMLVPLFFGIQLNKTNMIGLLLMVAGVLLLKLG